MNPECLILLGRSETSIFEIARELPDAIPCIADVCDADRIESVFRQFEPDIVFHAAAHKHVPLMEKHPCEAIKNNVFGTQNVCNSTQRKMIFVSTDKAVNPTSVMGATKRVAEMIVAAAGFTTVRFGNVLGSSGSVVPIFQKQIDAGGPVTVTHPEMTRYFMSIPEACELMIHAAGMGTGGDTFVFDMGEPVKILDLAKRMIGNRKIAIRFTGIRPGEKLHEELNDGQAEATEHPQIGRMPSTGNGDVDEMLRRLRDAVRIDTNEAAIAALQECVPEYAH